MTSYYEQVNVIPPSHDGTQSSLTHHTLSQQIMIPQQFEIQHQAYWCVWTNG